MEKGHQSGSMILEILLAFAIFSIICLPVLLFIFSSEEYQAKAAYRQSAAYADSVAENTQWFDPESMRGYSNRHSCDAALIEYAAAIASGTAHAPVVTYPNFFNHPRNIPTVLQYVPYGGYGYVIFGTNSASTSDPDLYVARRSGDGVFGPIFSLRSFGPGVVDFDFFNSYVFIAQRSLVNQGLRISLDVLLTNATAFASSSQGSSTEPIPQAVGLFPASLLPVMIPFGLPLRIMSSKDWVYLGLDKNNLSEVLPLKVQHRADGMQAHDGYGYSGGGIETDAGINDLARTPYEILVASPNPVEFNAFKLSENATTVAFSIIKNFDAPGSSGNGKAIATYKKDAYFGRTVGNVEFYKTTGLIDGIEAMASLASSTQSSAPSRFAIKGSVDLNKTILQIEEIFGGSFVLLLAKIPSPAIEVFSRNDLGTYVLKSEVALPASPTSMTCAGKDIVIGLESTTTPMAIIRL